MAGLERWRRKLREVGPAYAAVLALRRVVPDRLLRFYRCSVYALDARAARAHEPVSARWAAADEAALLGAFGHPREVIRERFAQGSLACVLESGGRLEAYVWFQPAEYFDADVRTLFRLPPADIWLYDAMVAPELRGQHIYPRLLARAAAMLKDRGIERIWILIDDLNRNSIDAHQAVGASATRQLSIVEVGGLARIRDERAGVAWLRPGATNVSALP